MSYQQRMQRLMQAAEELSRKVGNGEFTREQERDLSARLEAAEQNLIRQAEAHGIPRGALFA